MLKKKKRKESKFLNAGSTPKEASHFVGEWEREVPRKACDDVWFELDLAEEVQYVVKGRENIQGRKQPEQKRHNGVKLYDQEVHASRMTEWLERQTGPDYIESVMLT